MGLVPSLCSLMGISSEVLAKIIGLPAEEVERWRSGGVPLGYQGDFRVLEELMAYVAQRSAMPVRDAIRVPLPALGGASVLDMLKRQGALVAERRLRAAEGPGPVWPRAA